MNPAPKASPSPAPQPLVPPWVAWTLIFALGAFIAWWRPGVGEKGVNPEGWRLLAVFLPCILALMLQPVAGGAAVLMALLGSVLIGALKLDTALAGYMEPQVWLVLAAYFLARAFINTGLARRIALLFIRALGRTSLGLGYALVASDTVLAGMIPSNAARMGGVMLPITRSLAELFKSHPGASAGLLGRFLILALYQAGVVASALYFTGQSSNPLAAKQAYELTKDAPGGPVELSYGLWLLYASVPAILSLALLPWLIFKWERPAVTHTPEAAEFARSELTTMGPLTRSERVLTVIFAFTVTAWIVGGTAYVTLAGLCAVTALLLTRVLSWDDLMREHAAWDVFIWYGGLVQLGKQLKETGLLDLFAASVAGRFEGLPWFAVFVASLLVYFYAHYAFASITTHLISLYPAFVAVLIVSGAPPALVACSFAFFANFSAGLTHYGTTPAPIFHSVGYTTLATWWRIGLLASFVNIAVWLTAGLAWWKVLGLW